MGTTAAFADLRFPIVFMLVIAIEPSAPSRAGIYDIQRQREYKMGCRCCLGMLCVHRTGPVLSGLLVFFHQCGALFHSDASFIRLPNDIAGVNSGAFAHLMLV